MAAVVGGNPDHRGDRYILLHGKLIRVAMKDDRFTSHPEPIRDDDVEAHGHDQMENAHDLRKKPTLMESLSVLRLSREMYG